jgi:lipoate-protein ligase A
LTGDWRLIEDLPSDGFRNMALDEALLEACAGGAGGYPVLRLYSFSPSCLSLGFSQEHEGSADLAFCRGRGIDVVRRPTGGRAVLHDQEMTYAVVARRGRPPFEGSLLEVYRAVSRGLIAGFARLGIDASIAEGSRSTGSPRSGAICFAEPSRHEIVASGIKIAGSSQARRRGAFLQHGSIPIRLDPDLLERATGTSPIEGGGSPRAASLGLEPLLGRAPAAREISRALREGFETAFGIDLRDGGAAPEERERAEWLRAHRYLTAAWTLRR